MLIVWVLWGRRFCGEVVVYCFDEVVYVGWFFGVFGFIVSSEIVWEFIVFVVLVVFDGGVDVLLFVFLSVFVVYVICNFGYISCFKYFYVMCSEGVNLVLYVKFLV